MFISRWKDRTTMVRARRRFLAAFALLALMIALPQGALAQSLVPFQATMTETFTVVPCDPNVICGPITGSGQATHLGKTSESSEVFVDLLSNPGPTSDCPIGATNHFAETRTVTLSSANGDQITLALTGQSCDSSATPGFTGIASDTWVVTGGTGRFTGATGSGTNTALIDGPDLTSVTVFIGTLSAPGSL
jgi:hypothetical protein